MQPDAIRLARFIAFLLFIAVIFGGLHLLKNYERLFGVDPNQPSENSSSRSYGKVQALVVWLHAMLLTGGFAFLLH